MNIWGKNVVVSIFGESHGAAVGVVIDGLPPGFEVNWETVGTEMARRAPGRDEISTARKESDDWEILSGFFNGKTTGTPLTAIIRNKDTRSRDYNPSLIRPGHADLTALYKYKGHADYRGGGHFSGRLTAPVVFAGAIAKQLLNKHGIALGARIMKIGGVCDMPVSAEEIVAASKKTFPVHNDETARDMREAILGAKGEGDSVGGVIECAALGLPGGWGDPFFGSVESVISSMMFSIPAVKGIEFGGGFALADMKGSEANDRMRVTDGKIEFLSNNNGGILGGITSGEPLIFRVVIKPTPTITKEQMTVDTAKMETVSAVFGGRHDPCIVPRAVPVVEAGLAICLLDLSLNEGNVQK